MTCTPHCGDDDDYLRGEEIQRASMYGRPEVVKLLLANSTVDPADNNNKAIRDASTYGNTEVVKLLLANTRVDPSANRNEAIQQASRYGHTEVVKLLLVNSHVDSSANNNQAIQLASQEGRTEVVILLLEDPCVNRRIDPRIDGNDVFDLLSIRYFYRDEFLKETHEIDYYNYDKKVEVTDEELDDLVTLMTKKTDYTFFWRAESDIELRKRLRERLIERECISLSSMKPPLLEIPPSVFSLGNLTGLYLGNNVIKVIPPSISILRHLERLGLSGNGISFLPREFFDLLNLRNLFISNNSIRTLPREIGRLSKLEGLHLFDNELVSLPSELGKLSNLRRLYLHNNRLSDLPLSLGMLWLNVDIIHDGKTLFDGNLLTEYE